MLFWRQGRRSMQKCCFTAPTPFWLFITALPTRRWHGLPAFHYVGPMALAAAAGGLIGENPLVVRLAMSGHITSSAVIRRPTVLIWNNRIGGCWLMTTRCRRSVHSVPLTTSLLTPSMTPIAVTWWSSATGRWMQNGNGRHQGRMARPEYCSDRRHSEASIV